MTDSFSKESPLQKQPLLSVRLRSVTVNLVPYNLGLNFPLTLPHVFSLCVRIGLIFLEWDGCDSVKMMVILVLKHFRCNVMLVSYSN